MVSMTINEREQKGLEIADKSNQITRLDSCTYKVKSQSIDREYDVLKTELGWSCSCPDYIYRKVKCKHIFAVEFSVAIRLSVGAVCSESFTSISNCLSCGSSNIVKDGIRHNKHGNIQIFCCKDCGRYFTFNVGFERMKHNPQAITTAMQLYFSGESLRNTQKSLRLLGVEVSHQTIYNWISKYVKLMQQYVEKLKPNVSDTWRADELWVKVKGNMKYVFALMDDETRFWIAQEIADTKHSYDARRLFKKAIEIIGNKPKTLITDGLPAYHDAYLKELWTQKKETRTEHISTIRLRGNMNNNKMERFNGEVRDREKVMRGLKNDDTPIIKGYQIYHNFLREHEGLNGKTPSEACGIEIKGENKWLTLIQNAKLP